MCVWERGKSLRMYIFFPLPSPVFVNVGFVCVHVCGWRTSRMKRRRRFPKGSWEGTRGAGAPPEEFSPVLLPRLLLQRPRHRQSSLLENKSAFNNQRGATAGGNAGGFSGDVLETTGGARDRQEEGSV